MTPERLREIISGGESLTVEFKGEKRPLSDNDFLEAVDCLANRSKEDLGWLLVGVKDYGRVTGARPHQGDSIDPLRVQALIANRTRPNLTCRAEIVSLEGKPVLVIEVPLAAVHVGTSDGKYLRRIIDGKGKPECVPFFFHPWRLSRRCAS